MSKTVNDVWFASGCEGYGIGWSPARAQAGLAKFPTEVLEEWLAKHGRVGHNGCHEFGDVRSRHKTRCKINAIEGEVNRRKAEEN